MTDGPRRAGPSGDDYYDNVFRDEPADSRAPKYAVPTEPEAVDPDTTMARPARALDAGFGTSAFGTQPVDSLSDQQPSDQAPSAWSDPSLSDPPPPKQQPWSNDGPLEPGDSGWWMAPGADDPDDGLDADDTTSPGSPQRRADSEATGRHHPFTRSLIKTAASTIVPGSGMIRSRAKVVGWVLTALFVLGLVIVGAWVASDPVSAASTAVKPKFLKALSIVLVIGGALWVVVITGTHLVTRPRNLTRAQRVVGALTVAGLSFLIAAPLAVAARYSAQQASVVNDVFKKETDTKSQTRPTIDTGQKTDDVWAKKPRLNILLVGTDQTADRAFSEVDISTDTMMVASIDTATGNTVIIQIPRNMARMQFPKGTELNKLYPNGYYDGVNGDNAQYFANAVWAHVPAEHPDLFANTDYPGADALKLGMEGTLGLKIDYFVRVNIDGLVNLIDALNGVRINVNQRIPVASSDNKQATGYIEPGPNKLLSGYYAMWYARARHGIEGGDFDRMGRQTCVIKAVVDQVDPATMLTRYEAITNAGKDMLATDIPQEMLPHMVELARRVKNGKQTRVLFVHEKDGFVTYRPDFEMMRERVRRAIETVGDAKGGAPSTSSPKPTSSATSTKPSSPPTTTDPGASQSASPGSSSSVPGAESLTDACAYNPIEPDR